MRPRRAGAPREQPSSRLFAARNQAESFVFLAQLFETLTIDARNDALVAGAVELTAHFPVVPPQRRVKRARRFVVLLHRKPTEIDAIDDRPRELTDQSMDDQRSAVRSRDGQRRAIGLPIADEREQVAYG